jgi:hypothetical protein
MTEPQPAQPDRPTALNPLWIFSIFVGLCETTAGFAAAMLSGWVQAMLAIFAVSFPVVVLTVFLVILWRKPIVLYGPRDFPENVDVALFAQVMRHNLSDTIELVGTTAASSATAVAEELKLSDVDAQQLVERAKSAVETSLRSRVAKIDLSAFLGAGSSLEFVVSDAATVSDLLDAIYTAIYQHVPRYTYGVSWLVRVQGDGRLLKDIGTNWALNTGYGSTDTRKLIDVGVTGGMELAIVKL